jgi:hypothetical protein
MSKVHYISFEELAGNFADILNKVRDDHTTVIVGYASGEKLLIKRFSPSQPSAPKEQIKGAAPVANNSTLQQPPQDQGRDTDNISSVGAVYDIDPDSITPG